MFYIYIYDLDIRMVVTWNYNGNPGLITHLKMELTGHILTIYMHKCTNCFFYRSAMEISTV